MKVVSNSNCIEKYQFGEAELLGEEKKHRTIMFEIFCLKIHKFNQFGCDTTLLVDLLSLTFPGECLQNLELTIRKKHLKDWCKWKSTIKVFVKRNMGMQDLVITEIRDQTVLFYIEKCRVLKVAKQNIFGLHFVKKKKKKFQRST